MSSSPNIALSKPSRDLEKPIPSRPRRRRAAATTAPFLRLRQHRPDLRHPRATSWEHAILHAVQVAAVDGGHESAGDKTEYHPRREVVFAETMAQLEVLVEHCAERKGDRLVDISPLSSVHKRKSAGIAYFEMDVRHGRRRG